MRKLLTDGSLQAQAAYDKLSSKIEQLQHTVFAAEDGIFSAFCQQIGVENIREYEERQLKVAQEESEARLRFDTQIARLTHQYVLPSTSFLNCLLIVF